MKAFVITICQIAPMTKLRRKFGNKRLAVEGIVDFHEQFVKLL